MCEEELGEEGGSGSIGRWEDGSMLAYIYPVIPLFLFHVAFSFHLLHMAGIARHCRRIGVGMKVMGCFMGCCYDGALGRWW